jgi:hypothetical protein
MRRLLLGQDTTTARLGFRMQAGARAAILLILAILGIAGGIVWFLRTPGESIRQDKVTPVPGGLSDGTRAVLSRLNSPIELRFYSLLDPATVPARLLDFAARVNQLLASYEVASGGKITLKYLGTPSDANAAAARADGVRPFDLDTGDACYLGMAVVCGDRKEPLPQLMPEWEQALEADVSRAIARAAAMPASRHPPPTAPAENAAADKVRRLIPNLEATSVEEGTRILREAALERSRMAANGMAARLREAEQQLAAAREGGSEAEQQAVMEKLQWVRSDETEKLIQIAADLQDELAALKRLKHQ